MDRRNHQPLSAFGDGAVPTALPGCTQRGPGRRSQPGRDDPVATISLRKAVATISAEAIRLDFSGVNGDLRRIAHPDLGIRAGLPPRQISRMPLQPMAAASLAFHAITSAAASVQP